MGYKGKYFKIQELVPPEIYNKIGDKAWHLFDDRLLRDIDSLREKFGKVIINNWFTGGDRKYSGIRLPESPYYSTTSMHSYARAFDMLFLDTDVEEVRKYVINNWKEFEAIRGVELGTSWLHIDSRNEESLVTFSK